MKTMAQTATTCPRCRQPVRVEVEQLFDLNSDPKAKQRLLSGSANYIRCPNCGYEGPLATPIVYHDPEKELLLTYFPPELALPVKEQERLVGPLITQVTNRLPPDKRKAYLFRPQTMFTYDTLIEKVLEADGITKDMLQNQQKRLNLIQRLITASPEARPEIIRQEEALMDQDFFGIMSRIIEATMAQGDQQTARALAALQQELLSQTKLGQEIQSQARETEEAVKALQEASKTGLTREKLLDLFLNAKSDIALSTLISMARTGLDYNFYQILTQRIEASSSDEEKKSLSELRDKVIEMTKELDQAMQEQVQQTQNLLEEIVKAPNIEEAIAENAEAINELFIQVLRSEQEKAQQKADLGRMGKLQEILNVLQRMSAPPPEIALIEQMLQVDSEAERRKLLDENADMVNDEFVQMVTNLASQSEQQKQPQEVSQGLREISRLVLRYSMEKNFKK
jgi:hypothetical protein